MPETTHQPVVQNDSYTKIVAAFVPKDTKWQPQTAYQFMLSLVYLSAPIAFRTIMQAGRILWTIEAAVGYVEAIINTIYSFYPEAHIRLTDKRSADVGYYTYAFHGGVPFIGSLKHVGDLGSLDPLAGILNAFNDLMPDETVIYELMLTPVTEEHYKLGEELATRSLFTWWDYLSPRSAMTAAMHKLRGTDRVERFAPELQKQIEIKLGGPLTQAALSVKIKTQQQARAAYLVGLLEPAFAVFERQGHNFLVVVQPKSFPLVLSPAEAAALWHLPTQDCRVVGIQWAPRATPPPTAILHGNDGILLGASRYQGRSYTVRLPYEDRVTHISLTGKTRHGKSTLMHLMAHQDIGMNKGVAVIDPHGDLVEHILASSIPERREKDVLLFDIADRRNVIGLNLLAVPRGVKRHEAADHTLAVIRKMFEDQWSQTRTEDALYAALLALVGLDGATLLDIPRLFNDATFRQQVLSTVTDPITLEYWYQEYETLSERHQREIARPVNNRIRKFYRDEDVRRSVCQRDCLDFQAILDDGKIFLANLRGAGEFVGETLGALLISKIHLAAMSRGRHQQTSRRPFYLYIDEAQNFTTTSLATMFSEAGKYGLSLVLANQFLNQLAGETLDSVMGNVGTMVIFQTAPKDAKIFQRFTKPQFTEEDLAKLNRFTAVVKMHLSGKNLPAFSMRTHPPLPEKEDAKERVARIKMCSSEKYARPAEVVDAEMAERVRQVASNSTATGTASVEEMDFFG